MPLFIQLPLTVKVFEPVMVSDAPVLIVMLLQTAAALITGGCGVPDGIVTFVVASGIPPHQLEAVCQSELVIPTQVPEVTVIVTVFEVAGLPVAQVALEVTTQVITSVLTGT